MKKASATFRETRAMSAFEPGPRPGSPGQPESPLPLWTNLPMDAKIPLPPVVPKGKAVLCTTQIGEPLWRTPSDELGMDLGDPLLMQLPGPHQYNPMQDPFASGFLYHPRLRALLYRHQLITRKAGVLATLKNFNRFRDYLHSIRLRQLKKKKVDVELPLRTEYENLALDVVNEFRENEDLTQANEGRPLSARFSDIMRTEEEKLPAKKPLFLSLLTAEERDCLDEENRRFSSIRFAKMQNRESRLVAIKDWLRKDGRKGALIRLRQLQTMEERRKKGINNWKTRTAAQYEYFEELKKKEMMEAEVRRAQLTAKYRYRSAMNIAHDGKYDELIRRWREKRLRSKQPDFCGYAEPLHLRSTFMGSHDSVRKEKEYADLEMQTDDNTEADRLLQRKSLEFLLFDRSAGIKEDITEECEEQIPDYEKACREQYETMIYVHSEVICPAVAEFVGEEPEEVEEVRETRDVSTQTSLSEVVSIETDQRSFETGSREGTKRLGLTVPVPLRKGAGSTTSSHVDEIVFLLQENELLKGLDAKDEGANQRPPATKEALVDDREDRVQLLHRRLCDLERAMSDTASTDDLPVGAEQNMAEARSAHARGTRALNRAIGVRRSSELVAKEVVREALDGIGRELEGMTCGKDGGGGDDDDDAEAAAAAATGGKRRPTRSARLRQEVKAQRESCFTRLAVHFVRKAMSTCERLVRVGGSSTSDAVETDRVYSSSSAGDQESDFVRSFLDNISEGTRNGSLSAKRLLNLSAEFNRDICRRYEHSFLTDLETAQLARDRDQIEANQMVTACIDDVVNSLQAEGFASINFNLPSEANLSFSEALLNLSLHRDLEDIVDDRMDMDAVLDLVLRILQTHAQLTSEPSFPSRELLEDAFQSNRYVLGSVLLGQLVGMALDKLGDVRENCEMTAEHYIALAVGLDPKELICSARFKKSRAKRGGRGAVEQRKLREALADAFERKLKCQTDGRSDLLPAVCVEKAISEAVEKVYRASLPCRADHRRADYTPSSLIEIKWSLEAAAKDVIGTAVSDVAAKFRAARDDVGELESCLAEIDAVLVELDVDTNLATGSHLGLLARNSIDLSLEHFHFQSSSKQHLPHHHHADDEDGEVVDHIFLHKPASGGTTKMVRMSVDHSFTTVDDGFGSSQSFDRASTTEGSSKDRIGVNANTSATTNATTSSLHSAIKAPVQASDVALETLDLSVVPMFGSVPLNIHPDLVNEDLLMISIKHDEDLDNPDLSMRNSFRNVHRPDVSGLMRFNSMAGSTGSDHDSVHDRVRGAYMRRRSTTEEALKREAEAEASEYVTQVQSLRSESVARALSEESQANNSASSLPHLQEEGPTAAPPDPLPTVTVEYSKQFAFPDDPVATLVDNQSLVSYVLGETDEFHHLKISSTVTYVEEDGDDAAKGRDHHHHDQAAARKHADMISEEAGGTKNHFPEDESAEVVIATNDLVAGGETEPGGMPDETHVVDTADQTDSVEGEHLYEDGLPSAGAQKAAATAVNRAAADARPWNLDENLPEIVARLTVDVEKKPSSKGDLVSVVSLPMPPVPVNSVMSKVNPRNPTTEEDGREDDYVKNVASHSKTGSAIVEENSREIIILDPDKDPNLDPDPATEIEQDDDGVEAPEDILKRSESFEKLEMLEPPEDLEKPGG